MQPGNGFRDNRQAVTIPRDHPVLVLARPCSGVTISGCCKSQQPLMLAIIQVSLSLIGLVTGFGVLLVPRIFVDPIGEIKFLGVPPEKQQMIFDEFRRLSFVSTPAPPSQHPLGAGRPIHTLPRRGRRESGG